MASCDGENSQKVSLGGGLQGPRPPPLKIGKSSCKIKKKPLQQATGNPGRPPVIIYLRSPEVIHVEACNFMKLVQQLTGKSSSSSSSKANDGIGCNSIEVVEDVAEVRGFPAVTNEIDRGWQVHDALGEGNQTNLMHGMLPSQANIPPSGSPSPFMISPNVYANIQDFGMISYSQGYHDTVSTYPRFNSWNP